MGGEEKVFDKFFRYYFKVDETSFSNTIWRFREDILNNEGDVPDIDDCNLSLYN